MKKWIAVVLIVLLAGVFNAYGQFYSSGSDPSRLKWTSIETENYKIIYPGHQSRRTAEFGDFLPLALDYARELERFYGLESLSLGFYPNQQYSRPMPAIVHAFHGISNGSVSWAPRTLDIYSGPDAYRPEPMPWVTNLAVHESRHVAQMQPGRAGIFKPISWLLGEMAAGAVSALYPGPHLLEGDAVVAETGLTNAGRGRQAEFLEYYMASLEEGDARNWYRWRYGSWRYYAPDYYRLGYVTVAGARYLYDDPLFMQRYFSSVVRRPLKIGHLQKTMKQASGLKFRQSFDDILMAFYDEWKDSRESYGPFVTPVENVASPGPWYQAYSGLAGEFAGSGDENNQGLWAVKSDLRRPRSLVFIKDGREKRVRSFSAMTGSLKTDVGNNLWWSEPVADVRWDLATSSRIRYMEPGSRKIHNLTKKGRYFNPVPSRDGAEVAAVKYHYNGRITLDVLDAGTGETLRQYGVPDTLQAYELAWLDGGEGFMMACVSDHGEGLYKISDHGTEVVLAPRPVSIYDLEWKGGDVYFTSDRTGVGELYRISPESCRIWQVTSSRSGGRDYNIMGDYLYYTMQKAGGRPIVRASLSDLPDNEVNFNEIRSWAIADTLSAQERRLAREQGVEDFLDPAMPFDGSDLQPRRYRKMLHPAVLHSWVPLAVSVDDVSDLSLDYIASVAGLGATVYFQNRLGTLSGDAGYSWGTASDGFGKRSAGHLSFTYSGLYPVIEFTGDIGRRAAYQYNTLRQLTPFGDNGVLSAESVRAHRLSCPSLEAGVKVYVPLNFSSGGINRGLVPSVRWSFSNDCFMKSIAVLDYTSNFGTMYQVPVMEDIIPGPNIFLQAVSASVRGYVMRPAAEAATYPSLGIGAEIGYRARIGMTDRYSDDVYCYIYGYLPGIIPQQGLRVTATCQHQFRHISALGENAISTIPRGFSKTALSTFIGTHYSDQLKITADYSIPFRLFGDISCFCPVFYIKNFNVKPHADCTILNSGHGVANGNLCSFGADLTASLANFLWIPYPAEVGVTFSYNCGSLYDTVAADIPVSRTYAGMIFNIDF